MSNDTAVFQTNNQSMKTHDDSYDVGGYIFILIFNFTQKYDYTEK